MRHNPSTVVVLAGHPSAGLLGVVARFMNVSLVQSGGSSEDAASTLRRAAGITAPYVLVAADPLAAVAAEWESMWEISDAPRGGGGEFELRAGEVLASWRARQFELPDYYLVLAQQPPADVAPRPEFHLGSLRHGRWWPPLPEVIDSARGFYPGSLAETPEGAAVPLLG